MASKTRIKALEDYLDSLTDNETEDLPVLPTNTLEWIEKARPMLGKVERNFDWEPFWIDVYEDNHPNIVVVNGRQTYKSTFGTDLIGCSVTSSPGIEATYIVDRQDRARAWSIQRFRRDTILSNPPLRVFLPNGRANVTDVSFNNQSVLYVRTDENEYNNVQGMSNSRLVFDECQYQELEFRKPAINTITQKRAQVHYLGIGGESGGEWYKLWSKSDQREWVFKDKYWREKLKFDSEGNLANEHPENIMAGRWVPQKPENREYRGYHMPQTIFARIPLTIDDAIMKYHKNPEISIEFQRKYNPHSVYLAHCLGEFYKAERRPITPDMVEACYNRTIGFLKPEEVRELKGVFQNEIYVFGGNDWGSGPAASSTVAAVGIYWRRSNRMQLAHIEWRPQEHSDDQARYMTELFGREGYNIDYGLGDLGYGPERVKHIQDGGRDSKDNKYTGLGRSKYMGCRWIGTEVKEKEEYKFETDEHGSEVGRVQVDHTQTIQNFVDTIGMYVSHPLFPEAEKLKRTVLMIPYNQEAELEIGNRLMDDFTAVLRNDLEKQQEVPVEDPRQKPRKQFDHPRDSVVAISNLFVAKNNYDPGKFSMSLVGGNR